MSNILWKNMHLCFSKLIKYPPDSTPPPSSRRRRRIAIDQSRQSLLLYDSNTTTTTTEDFSSSSSSSSSDEPLPPDFAAAFASQRFFFSSPGRSNSIVDSSPETSVVGGGVAVPTDSPDPYRDFRRSMQEMVEVRRDHSPVDWEYLQELLLCYLALNPKNAHKFIVRAFSDLLLSLVSPSGDEGGRCEI